MSTTINLPVLLAQLPHLAKVASVQQQGPKTQAEFAEQLSREQSERAKDQVQKTKEQDKTTVTGDQERQEAQQRKASDKREQKPEEESQEEETLVKSPWAGNIINLKI
ncbi:hypothetical protein [Desulfovibrio ferrophilus]|uniref:Uncharacterized protein n=1 Tax=Desulfovibrio ferrophilus TaxID=241368 RepID=A0A2Z6AXP0_9BACT|nr:hypothetical protein [Desulfovibrio ferrophilus]BBD07978.1 putative uncharacterized protein [Desulfovibrio ferrophilus]